MSGKNAVTLEVVADLVKVSKRSEELARVKTEVIKEAKKVDAARRQIGAILQKELGDGRHHVQVGKQLFEVYVANQSASAKEVDVKRI
jgi:DNA repair ATPase RecN